MRGPLVRTAAQRAAGRNSKRQFIDKPKDGRLSAPSAVSAPRDGPNTTVWGIDCRGGPVAESTTKTECCPLRAASEPTTKPATKKGDVPRRAAAEPATKKGDVPRRLW